MTPADQDFLKTRACEFVSVLANSHLMQGFTFSEKNRFLVGNLAATALLGYFGPEDELPPKFKMARQYVYNNLHQAGWCHPIGQPPPAVPSPSPWSTGYRYRR